MEELINKELKSIKSDINMISNIAFMGIDEFRAYGFIYKTEDNRKFYFMDNRADILAVAHLDTVQPEPAFKYFAQDNVIKSSVLDDRLGVYLILEHLMQDLDYDVLLTKDEEIGKSTARSFNIGKNYNWIFSFDRKGTDVVMYNYESPEMISLLSKYGFKAGKGTYSDICELEHLGCKGFNFGTGYYNAHSKQGYARLDELARNIVKFREFYNENKDIKLPHRRKSLKKPGNAEAQIITYEITE